MRIALSTLFCGFIVSLVSALYDPVNFQYSYYLNTILMNERHTESAVSITETHVEDSSGVIADNATLQLISKQFAFTEGPAVDKVGNIFFTDQPNDKIWKYGLDGSLSLFMDKTGRSNGLYFD